MIKILKQYSVQEAATGFKNYQTKLIFHHLKKNPKWYVGFSDITVLHLWLSEVCGIISIHGEMPLNY